MGRMGRTDTASERYPASSDAELTRFIAAPESTYDGRTSTGYPTFSANSFAWSMVRSSLQI